MQCAGPFLRREGWGHMELVGAGVAHRPATKGIKALLEESLTVSEWTLRESCLIGFVPLHGQSFIEGNSKNDKHPEVYYFKAYDITDYYIDLLITFTTIISIGYVCVCNLLWWIKIYSFKFTARFFHFCFRKFYFPFLNLPSLLTLSAFFFHLYTVLTCKSINKIKVFGQLRKMEIGFFSVNFSIDFSIGNS